MFSRSRRSVVVPSLAAALAALTACARSVDWATTSTCSEGPPAIAAPDGNELAFELFAEGVQIYKCARPSGAATSGAAPTWELHAPEANLMNRHGVYSGKHRAGPTWEAPDGSRVVGAKIAGVPSDRASIPWLLLRATSHPGADGSMADVTFVQRVGTWGGNAPSDGCSADSVGAIVRVPYRAVYCFYRGKDAHATRGGTTAPVALRDAP